MIWLIPGVFARDSNLNGISLYHIQRSANKLRRFSSLCAASTEEQPTANGGKQSFSDDFKAKEAGVRSAKLNPALADTLCF